MWFTALADPLKRGMTGSSGGDLDCHGAAAASAGENLPWNIRCCARATLPGQPGTWGPDRPCSRDTRPRNKISMTSGNRCVVYETGAPDAGQSGAWGKIMRVMRQPAGPSSANASASPRQTPANRAGRAGLQRAAAAGWHGSLCLKPTWPLKSLRLADENVTAAGARVRGAELRCCSINSTSTVALPWQRAV